MSSYSERAGKVTVTALSVFVAFTAGLLVSYFFTVNIVSTETNKGSHGAMSHKMGGLTEKKQIWTCSMHPQIKLPKSGKCPICFMDLIVLESSNDNEEEREISLSKWAAKNIQIETTEVKRRFVEAKIRMTGKISYDETKVSYISAWIPGRLDRLFVNYTGIAVKKGDHMVEIYSPDLLVAQEELIQAIDTVTTLSGSDSIIIRQTAKATVEAAREKLRLLGLGAKQIKSIEKNRKIDDHITIYAPQSGFVIHKNAQEGMYVKTGTRIYTISDLSTVWVKLDAYESDLQWLRYGSEVEFSTETHKGRTFRGTISFIDLDIDENSRTAKVRVTVKNDDLALKPGMFVRAIVKAKVTEGGQVVAVDMQGKWICPMHPDIVKNHQAKCDICGMPLVTAESLGFVFSSSHRAPLVIPATSPLLTGKRAVVYVQLPHRDNPVFQGRDVVLGDNLEQWYIVKDGLKEGERIVTRGAFKLDAELQIRAQTSMMSASDSKDVGPDIGSDMKPIMVSDMLLSQALEEQLEKLISAYYELSQSLGDDNFRNARKSGIKAAKALQDVDMNEFKGKNHMIWMPLGINIKGALDKFVKADNIVKQREAFFMLSGELIRAFETFPLKVPIYKAFCPMAFNNAGGFWLSPNEEIANPYFGAAMYGCGEIKGSIVRIGSGANDSHK
jgi:Cu(I)/Ag(I) efflux system membrane fusion protein